MLVVIMVSIFISANHWPTSLKAEVRPPLLHHTSFLGQRSGPWQVWPHPARQYSFFFSVFSVYLCCGVCEEFWTSPCCCFVFTVFAARIENFSLFKKVYLERQPFAWQLFVYQVNDCVKLWILFCLWVSECVCVFLFETDFGLSHVILLSITLINLKSCVVK